MKKNQVSIIFSLSCILGIFFQNYRLAKLYDNSVGKTRALFGLTEIANLDIKVYLAFASLISLVFGILAIRNKENLKLAIISIALSSIAIILLFIRLCKFMI